AQVDLEPVARQWIVIEQLGAEMSSGYGQFDTGAKVCLYELSNGDRASPVADRSGRGAVAALELVTVHSGPAADRSLGHRTGGRRVQCGLDMLGPDGAAVDFFEVRVP